MPYPQQPNNNRDLLRYAGLGGQIFAGLGLAVWLGYKVDGWTNMPFPLFVWALPLAVLSVMIWKLVNDTSKRKKEDA
jgi:hypothetical protein